MPDHLHLLLIVDYSKAREFDILDWFQHFRREGEDLVAPLIGEKAPFVWEDHFWLLLVNAGRPLAAVRKYIKMNPARKMWKRLNPDRFVRRSGLKHAVLDPSLSWTAIGDLTLLANPFMFPVRLTRKMTVEQHLPEIERMVEKARRGMLPVCGFLSPGEKELERRLRQEPFARWIKTVAHGLPLRFDPTVEDSRFLADGRQLILSSFPSDVPVFPVNYDNCHLMNARNEALCRRATGGERGERKGAPDLLAAYKTLMRYKKLSADFRKAIGLQDPNPASLVFDGTDEVWFAPYSGTCEQVAGWMRAVVS